METIELKIAVRNLIANSRRTLLTLFIIVIGLTAILFIAGYINMVRIGFGEILINEKYSHFQIYKRGFLELDDKASMKLSLTPDDISTIESILLERDEVMAVFPRINVQGMIGNMESSRLFLGYGSDPYYEKLMTYGTILKGMKLSDEDPYMCVIGTGLAERLNVSLDDPLLISVPNEGGGLEAESLTVGGIANFGPQELNDTAVMVSLEVAQSLNYTDNAQSILVLLHDTEFLEEVYEYFLDEAGKSGLDIETMKWIEMDPFYLSVMRDYTFQLNLIATIFFFVILLAVSNTIYMAIIERTPEIGTLRAIGISRMEIIRTILLEGLILGITGVITGVGGGYLIETILQFVYIELPPPPSLTNPIRLAIALRIQDVLLYSGILAACTVIATLFPGLKASNTNIVSAIRHA